MFAGHPSEKRLSLYSIPAVAKMCLWGSTNNYMIADCSNLVGLEMGTVCIHFIQFLRGSICWRPSFSSFFGSLRIGWLWANSFCLQYRDPFSASWKRGHSWFELSARHQRCATTGTRMLAETLGMHLATCRLYRCSMMCKPETYHLIILIDQISPMRGWKPCHPVPTAIWVLW